MTNGFSDQMQREMAANHANPRVGQTLVSQSERVRVWQIALAPGERLPFHKHVLDYFWTATRAGKARSHYGDGKVVDMAYAVGDTRHYHFAAGESLYHDLENIGAETLSFVTVEFLASENALLPL